jgi:DNA-binding winged helix-turn-helix (wHTH) protein/cytochrome c-type biogenesis protein CcmH/NrfG
VFGSSRYTFDRFEIDPVARTLTHGGEAVRLPERHFDVLLALVSRAGSVVSKDTLIEVAWRDVAVTDNSLEQAISLLRRTLGSTSAGDPYIATVPRQGYRFTGSVTQSSSQASDARLEDLLTPHRAWLEGRAALETLSGRQCADALQAFERALQFDANYAAAHVGVANACAFQFEASRADVTPDRLALTRSVEHARNACRLSPDWGEAWATLGFVLNRVGHGDDGLAALRRATTLEPDNWRHHLRAAVGSWGEERLRAADRTLQLMPGLALAHWLVATVHVARQSFERAEREVETGAAAQDAQAGQRFAAVGLHWLHGLLRLHRGDAEGAREAFARELAFEPSGHLYARECCAQVWYSIGAIANRAGDTDQALSAFGEALARVPGHPLALAATAALRSSTALQTEVERRLTTVRSHGACVDAGHAEAVHATLLGDADTPQRTLWAALRDASPGQAGWSLPLDPILVPGSDPRWSPVLAALRARAA